MSSSEQSIARAQELADEVSGQPDNVDAALPELASLLRSEDPEVLIAVVLALGEAWDERAAALLLPLVGHADALVREAVAHALPSGIVTGPTHDLVTQALVTLAADDADEVRNWACFGLGQLDADGPEVRSVLLSNLDNADLDTRSEALVALARLGEPASLTATLERLAADPDEIALLEVQAAAELADPALLPALERLAAVWAGDEDAHTVAVDFALRRCRPAAAAEAAALEAQLVEGANSGLESSGLAIRLEGGYPRTVAHMVRPDQQAPEYYRVWDELEPGTFDLEQQVASLILTGQD